MVHVMKHINFQLFIAHPDGVFEKDPDNSREIYKQTSLTFYTSNDVCKPSWEGTITRTLMRFTPLRNGCLFLKIVFVKLRNFNFIWKNRIFQHEYQRLIGFLSILYLYNILWCSKKFQTRNIFRVNQKTIKKVQEKNMSCKRALTIVTRNR